MKVVLDTSGWMAIVVESDQMHRQAAEFLKNKEPEIIVTPSVFEEIIALLHHRLGKKVALKSGNVLRKMGIIKLTNKDRQVVWDLYRGSSAKVSYVDCCVTTTAKALAVPVLAFDKHFIKLGVRVVP